MREMQSREEVEREGATSEDVSCEWVNLVIIGVQRGDFTHFEQGNSLGM